MNVRVTTLPSGLRIVSDRMESVETVSLGAWIGVGTRHEAAPVNGVSHLLEHMAFKGTPRRDARAIAEEIEAVGGQINAHTSREYTAYYAKVLKEDIPLAVDVIADILQHSLLDPEELTRERAVVLQEIHQAFDTPDDIVFDYFQESAFPGQALGRPVLGTAERVGDMSRDVLLAHMRGHYTAPLMTFSAAGNVHHDRLVDQVAAAFDSLPTPGPKPTDSANYRGGEAREERDLEQVNLVLGFEGLRYDDPDYYALLVLSALFGGGMSSRLFQEVREKRGLVYSIYSYFSCYGDCGLFGIYAGTGPEEVAELVPVVCDEIVSLRRTIDEREVARAKAQLRAGVLMGLESTGSRCEQLARQMQIFGRPLPPEEIVRRIEAVDIPALEAVARRVTAGRPTLAAVGPLAGMPSLDWITERLAAD